VKPSPVFCVPLGQALPRAARARRHNPFQLCTRGESAWADSPRARVYAGPRRPAPLGWTCSAWKVFMRLRLCWRRARAGDWSCAALAADCATTRAALKAGA